METCDQVQVPVHWVQQWLCRAALVMFAVEELCRQGPGRSLSWQISWTFHFRDSSPFSSSRL